MRPTAARSGSGCNDATGERLHELFRELFALHDVLNKLMDEIHEKAGMSTSQLKVMRVLIEAGESTVPDAAARLGVSPQFVQTVYNNLTGQEFITYRENPRHKRSRLAALTVTGQDADRLARTKENEIIESALPGICGEEAKVSWVLLARIRENLELSSDQI